MLQAWQQFCSGNSQPLQQCLEAEFPPDECWARADFDRSAEFQRRWQWLEMAQPQLQEFFAARNFPDTWILPLWSVWLPLACQLQDWQRLAHPTPQIIGFLGGQGSGKTTLTTLLKCLLELQGYRVLAWSIDDLYLPYEDRLALAQQDPRLIWRGPPGTHDVSLGRDILQQFKARRPSVAVPRFDKSRHSGAGDRSGFEPVDAVDFVLFEGWFVGAQPLAPERLEQLRWPDPIRTAADRQFAQDMNQALQTYQPLWAMLDHLVVLQLQDYRWSQQWRQQAEQQMRAQGLPGMSDLEIQAFVEYFWRTLHPDLFITPLAADGADLVLEIGADHLPDRVYRPGA
ncbi:glycerate kinase [filamentous cyanobacterium LEGE 11480]|uniref:Glycerate kinase n=2 Tax=Romeriopsis TaxID=2992131 RepID=A0A928VML9_9CYAN|nr:glycerate kinase [Romeriopsis navalis LEGE 11480]